VKHIHNTGVIYDRHLRSSKYFYKIGQWIYVPMYRSCQTRTIIGQFFFSMTAASQLLRLFVNQNVTLTLIDGRLFPFFFFSFRSHSIPGKCRGSLEQVSFQLIRIMVRDLFFSFVRQILNYYWRKKEDCHWWQNKCGDSAFFGSKTTFDSK